MVTKASISKVLSESIGMTLSDSKAFTNSFINIIKKNAFHNKIKLHGFGTFYVHNSPKRVGRNPKTKEEFIISERNSLRFTPSKKLSKDELI